MTFILQVAQENMASVDGALGAARWGKPGSGADDVWHRKLRLEPRGALRAGQCSARVTTSLFRRPL